MAKATEKHNAKDGRKDERTFPQGRKNYLN